MTIRIRLHDFYSLHSFRSITITSILVFTLLFHPSKAQVDDWRNIRNGLIIPDETYSDQPYIVKTDDGAWLCVLTTGAGKEGQSGQFVATTRSLDKGRTWSKLVPLEPPDGPEASYAVTLKVPSGRVYAFYNHNTDNIREIKTDDGGSIRRVDSQGHFVFKYSDDHGKSWSARRYTVPVRAFEIDRNNIYGGEIRFFWNVGKAFILNGSGYVPLHKVGGFGEGFFTSNEGVLLKSANILIETDPEKIIWETLPEGDIGLRTPPGGGPIAAEQSFSVLSDGSLYCVYRTIDGYPVYTYSRDGGYTWDVPKYLLYANGRHVKHPRAANFAWRCENGKYLYWFHNHGGRFIRDHPQRRSMAYNDRNPAWLAGGIERDGPTGRVIEWTQPEILLYDDDPLIRMSYPDLVEEDGNYYISETQKDVARVHKVDRQLLDLLWGQLESMEKTTDGLVAEWEFKGLAFPVHRQGTSFGPFYVRDPNRDDHGGMNMPSGFTLDLAFELENTNPGQVLLDTRNESGQGIWLVTAEKQDIRFSMSDGRSVSSWDCDPEMISSGQPHYLSVIVDGGPKMIMFVVDGLLNDGGDSRQFGWGRFNSNLQEVNGSPDWAIGDQMAGRIDRIRIYNRPLQISESIANYKFYLSE